jgi:hypothetical protein
LDQRTFTVRVCGPINQMLLRNLLLWQNDVLRSYPELSEGHLIDIVFLIEGSADNPRYFDLFSAALMLERVRDVCLVDREEAIDDARRSCSRSGRRCVGARRARSEIYACYLAMRVDTRPSPE